MENKRTETNKTVQKRLEPEHCLNMPGMWKIITVPHALM